MSKDMRYDVVILGDIGPQQLSAASQQALDEFVRKRGGNLVVVAGQNSMPAAFAGQPLIDLLPVEQSTSVTPQQGYSLRLTDEGRVNSALLIDDSPEESRAAWQETFERFPVYGLSEFCRPKASARTLIEAVTQSAGQVTAENADHKVDNAFLSWQRVGAGRIAYLAAGDTYRLRWRRGDRYHHRFWGQFLRWLTAANTGAGSEIVRLQTDRTRYSQREPVEVTVWLKDSTGRPLAGETIQAEARPFKGDALSVELAADKQVPGRYFATHNNLPPGAYKIESAGRRSTHERERVRDRLLDRASADERISGVAITGSGAEAAEDVWSDIDLFFGIDSADPMQVLTEWSDALEAELDALNLPDLLLGS